MEGNEKETVDGSDSPGKDDNRTLTLGDGILSEVLWVIFERTLVETRCQSEER